MTNTISACLIVQDEEECVQRAIDSIKDYVDEIVILDGGSTDRTREICLANEKVKLFDIPFNPLAGDRFDTQKNNAIERALNEWILFIDADEFYNSYVGESLGAMIDPNLNDGIDAYAFSRKTFIDGRLYNYIEQDWQIRLFKSYCRYGGAIHEGIFGYNKHSFTNLDIMHYKKAEWQQKDNERVWDMGQEPPEGWVKFNGKWEWMGNGYDYPDERFWDNEKLAQRMHYYDMSNLRHLYNELMPVRQPALPVEELRYGPGEYSQKDAISQMSDVDALDVGCANGRFGVCLLRDDLINSFTGIDVSDMEVENAKTTAINADVVAEFLCSSLEEFTPDRKYDLVIANDVIEHVYSPLRAVRIIIDRFLSPDGMLVGSVPYLFECNCDSHLHYFSESSLRQFLEQFFNDVTIIKKDYYDNWENHYAEWHLGFICRSPK